jgi:hypothetical protein
MSDADIVYKVRDGRTGRDLYRDDTDGNGSSLVASDDQETLSEEQQDVICRLVAMMARELRMSIDDHSDMITTLRERVANLEGQLTTLTSLLGTNGSNGKTGKAVKTIEASETVRKRKMRVT